MDTADCLETRCEYRTFDSTMEYRLLSSGREEYRLVCKKTTSELSIDFSRRSREESSQGTKDDRQHTSEDRQRATDDFQYNTDRQRTSEDRQRASFDRQRASFDRQCTSDDGQRATDDSQHNTDRQPTSDDRHRRSFDRQLASDEHQCTSFDRQYTTEDRQCTSDDRECTSYDRQQQITPEESEHNGFGGIDEDPAYNFDHNIPRDNKVFDYAQPETIKSNGLSSNDRETCSLHSETDDGSGEGRQFSNGDHQQHPILCVEEPDLQRRLNANPIFKSIKAFIQDDQSQAGIVDDVHVKLGGTSSANKPAENVLSDNFRLNHKCPATFIAKGQRMSKDHGESYKFFKPGDHICGRRVKRSPQENRQIAKDDGQEILASSDMEESGTFTPDDSLSVKTDEIRGKVICCPGNVNKYLEFGRTSTLAGKQRNLHNHSKSRCHFKPNENISTTRRLLPDHRKHCDLNMFTDNMQAISDKAPALSFVSSELQTHLPSNDGATNHKISCNMCDLNNFSSADGGVRALKREKTVWIGDGFLKHRHFARIDSCTSPVLSRKMNKNASDFTPEGQTTSMALEESCQAVLDIGDEAPHSCVAALVNYFENLSRLVQKSPKVMSLAEQKDRPCFFKEYPCPKFEKIGADSIDGSGEGHPFNNGDCQQWPTLDIDELDIFESSKIFAQGDESQFGIVDEVHLKLGGTNSTNKPVKTDYFQLDQKCPAKFIADKQRSWSNHGEIPFTSHLLLTRSLEESCTETSSIVKNYTSQEEPMLMVEKDRNLIIEIPQARISEHMERIAPKSVYFEQNVTTETDGDDVAKRTFVSIVVIDIGDWRLQGSGAKSIFHTNPNILDTSNILFDENNPSMHDDSNILPRKTVHENSDNFERNTGQMLVDTSGVLSEYKDLKSLDYTNTFPEQKELRSGDIDNLPEQEDQRIFGGLVHFLEQEGLQMSYDREKISEQDDRNMFDGLDHFPAQEDQEMFGDLVKFPQPDDNLLEQECQKIFDDGLEQIVSEIIDNSNFLREGTGDFRPEVKNSGTFVSGLGETPAPASSVRGAAKETGRLATEFGVVSQKKRFRTVPAKHAPGRCCAELPKSHAIANPRTSKDSRPRDGGGCARNMFLRAVGVFAVFVVWALLLEIGYPRS